MKWIDCNDHLPPDGERVLFWHTAGTVCIGRLRRREEDEPTHWEDEETDGQNDRVQHSPEMVTHWMPLPGSPQAQPAQCCVCGDDATCLAPVCDACRPQDP